jgi:hypothetical protein
MSRRYRVSAVLNVESQIEREFDIEKVEPAFESVSDAQVRNRTLIKQLRAGDEKHHDLAEKIARCDHAAKEPCRVSICHVCSRENRRLFVADSLKVLGLTPDSDTSKSSHLFITIVDHRWISRWEDFEKFDMHESGESLIQKLQKSNLEIERLVGAWDFLWVRWELNDDPPQKKKIWAPHVHAAVKTRLSLEEFRARLRPLFERKVLLSVERPTTVKLISNPTGALSYIKKQMFGQRNISELRPASRHQNPVALGPDKVRQLCAMLHRQGYKARHVLIGCRLRKGRIKSID